MAQANQTKQQTTCEICLPLDRTHQEDVYVAVNGQAYLIQRGKRVTVPKAVAQVLAHREEMLRSALEYERTAAKE